MKILLIWPPWYRLQNSEFVGYPIGITSIAAILEKNGFNVSVYHADYKGKGAVVHTSELTNAYEDYKRRLADENDAIWKEVEAVIVEQKPDIVGISVMTGSYGSALMTAKIAKKINPNTIVVMGGAHPTVEPKSTLRNSDVDFVVAGEGEETFLELVQAIESRKRFSEIKGIGYKKGRQLIINPRRPLIENLDTLPLPARHLIINKENFIPDAFGGIFSSRGCPFNCIYCSSHTIWGRHVRFRSVDNVIEEMKNVLENYKAKHFFFVDDSFSLRRDRVLEMCDKMIQLQKNRSFTWHCQTRVDLLNEELAAKMKQARCNCVLIGIETGYEEGLKKIKKSITLDQVRNASSILKKYKIPVNTFFMIGFPWETMEEINASISFMKEIDPDDASYAIVTPQPGTELFDMVKKLKLLPKNVDWSSFQHQSPDMFFTKNFSKQQKREIIEKAESEFDAQKHKKLREQIRKNPLSLVSRAVKGGHYKHPVRLIKLGYRTVKN
ncbi:MAG: radical SAM protein [Candidatus Aenigmatarchaeota archaeon]